MPMLKIPHWFPNEFRIKSQVLAVTHKAPHELALDYLPGPPPLFLPIRCPLGHGQLAFP